VTDNNTKKKIVLVCVTSNTVVGFRRDLILKLKDQFQVTAIAFDKDHEKEIKDLGVDFYCVGGSHRSLNPFKVFALKRKYYKIIKTVNPDVVFTFMLKPNIFGTLAAKKAGVKKIFSMVEGAGDAFTYDTFKWRLIRKYVTKKYRKAFNIANKVVFLNQDDKKQFINEKIVVEDKTEIINGIGVNLETFEYKPIKNDAHFIMVARLNVAKGIYEYLRAAESVKQKYPNATFDLLGAEGNVSKEDIKGYVEKGIVNYLGVTSDVRPYLENCTAFVLPSYREGLPMSVIEAESVGRPVITTRTNGCIDCVKDGYNGYLVNVKEVSSIAEKMIYFIENPEKAIEMGKNSRAYAEENFDQKVINQKMLDLILE